MSFCARCEGLPEVFAGDRDLFFWAPIGHAAGKIEKALRANGGEARRDAETGALVLTAGRERAISAMDALGEALSRQELADVKVLVKQAGQAPGPADYAAVVSLAETIARLRADWLIETLRAGRLPVAFAPIAFADSPDEIAAHLGSVDLAALAAPQANLNELLVTARDAGLLFQTDRLARISAIKAMEREGIDTPVFIPFSPAAIYDPVFCLRTTIEAAERADLAQDAIRFTVVAADRDHDPQHLLNILDHYRRHGFRVAMAGIGSGFTSFELLQHLKPDTIFIDDSLTRGVASDLYNEVIARKLLEIAHRLQIETVVAGVQDAEQVNWAYEHGADYVTGPGVAAAARRSGAAA